MADPPLSAPLFSDPRWQMTYGERSALEGLLSHVKPSLAIETGTAQGGSLRRIAAHSEEVHAFDVVESVRDLGAEILNAHFHIGDSAKLLPEVLGQFERDGRHVDFALIDGDHSVRGVQRDARALLGSGACRRTVIVFHDSANDDVRVGLEALDLAHNHKVAIAILDFVPGYLVKPDHASYPHAIWNGLALVVLDDGREGPPILQDDRYSVAEVYQRARELFEGRNELPRRLSGHDAPPPTPPPRRGVLAGTALLGCAAGAAAALLGNRRRR
jgi:Methyltransferase domain